IPSSYAGLTIGARELKRRMCRQDVSGGTAATRVFITLGLSSFVVFPPRFFTHLHHFKHQYYNYR
ncbi:hypothetical protein L9F63_000978, partial [Diploptera punctata]